MINFIDDQGGAPDKKPEFDPDAVPEEQKKEWIFKLKTATAIIDLVADDLKKFPRFDNPHGIVGIFAMSHCLERMANVIELVCLSIEQGRPSGDVEPGSEPTGPVQGGQNG